MRTKNINQIPDITLPSISKRDPFAHLKTRVNYLTNLKHIGDGYEAKQSHVDAMKRHIENQKMLNYQMEYDRVITALNHSATPGMSLFQLDKRKQELRKLGIKSVSVM
jgi:hypothetical protein